MQIATRLTARFALALSLLTPAACTLLGKPGASAVAQGRYYSTGNPEYDSFFIELHRLQVELKDSPERTAEPRKTLAEALDVGLDADVIKEALGKKASDLASRQVKFSVQRPANDDKPLSLRVSGNPTGDDAALQKTLEETLAKISELQTATAGWQKSLEPLPDRAASLESGVDTAFANSPPRTVADVKANLSDGRKIIDILVTRAKEADQANSELLGAITGALGETAAASGEKPSEPASAPAASNEKKGRKASPPEKHSKAKASHAEPPAKAPKSEPPPKATPPKPAPKVAEKPPEKPKPEPKPEPKPAPAERSEVPPPPKPTQGTAKPDFEP